MAGALQNSDINVVFVRPWPCLPGNWKRRALEPSDQVNYFGKSVFGHSREFLRIFALTGLLIAVVGVGSVKCNCKFDSRSCKLSWVFNCFTANTFAANQYKSDQTTQLSFYFSMQYFCMKSGSIIGRFFNPILRQDVKCFGMNDCYPIAFAVPGKCDQIAMLLFCFLMT